MKILIALALVAASSVAMATDVTVSGGRAFGPDATFGSVAVGNQFGAVRGEVSAAHSFTSNRKANIIGVAGTLPLLGVKNVTLGAKVGVSYVIVPGAPDGAALSAGAVATLPLTKTLSLVGTVEHVVAQKRVSGISGNVASVGVRATF